jgi:hypothetical protein
VHDVYIALVTVGGSLLTGLLVAWSTLRASRAERAEQRRRDLDNAAAEFLAAIVQAVAFLSDLPHIDERHPIVMFGNLSDRIQDAVSPGSSWLKNRRGMRRYLGEQPFLPAERVVDAASRLQVLDPGPELAAAVDAAIDYMIALGGDRTQPQLEKWPEIRRQLLDAIALTRNRELATA